MKREQCLDKAKDLIDIDRAAQYGDAHDTHDRIAILWSAIIGNEGKCLSGHDVALMMIGVKLVRAAKNPQYADSWVDIAGYAALGAEIAGAE